MAVTLKDSDVRAGEPSTRLFDPGGAKTLDDKIVAVSRSLTVRGNARCLVCGATLVRSPGGAAAGSAAECAACGTSLE